MNEEPPSPISGVIGVGVRVEIIVQLEDANSPIVVLSLSPCYRRYFGMLEGSFGVFHIARSRPQGWYITISLIWNLWS